MTRSSGTSATRPTPGSSSPAGTTTFPTLRQRDGISGFLKRSESEHDQFGAGHAGTAMSAALGMATARDLKGEQHKVVAVVGDGALTCGLSYEGMNNAGHSDRDIILIVNDNGMSISPNVGAISKMLGRIVADPRTNRLREKDQGDDLRAGRRLRRGRGGLRQERRGERQESLLAGDALRGARLPLLRPDRRARSPEALRHAAVRPRHERPAGDPRDDPEGEGIRLRRDRTRRSGTASRPTIRSPARRGRRRAARRPGPRCSATASPRSPASIPSWWRSPPRCRSGTGTNIFQKKYPERFFDVGIAEGHAVTFAGGLATQGIRPVVRDLQHLPPARVRQRHPRHRRAASAGDVLHGPRGAGGRGRPDPHGAVRHRLHAGGAGDDGDGAQGRRRADRPAPHRAGAHGGPFCTRYPRDKAPAEPRPAAEIPAVPYGTWEQLRRGQGRRDPGRRHHGAARAARRPSCWPPTASTARW